MIADRLILHHTYRGTTAYDISEHNHHGHLENVTCEGLPVVFTSGPQCIRVPVTKLLANLRAVRTTISFKLAANAEVRRHNLMEGFLSFAFVIGDDRSLQGGILNREGNWVGTSSAPGVVKLNKWHEATFVHDGLSAARLDLDGVTVAESFDLLGPISGIQAPYGLAIGHWPDPGDQYTFEGKFGEVRVWIDDPDAGRPLIDECCIDRAGIDEFVAAAAAAGLTGPALDESMNGLVDLGHRVFGRMANGGEPDRAVAFDLARQFVAALATKDQQRLGDTIVDAAAVARSKMSDAEIMVEFDKAVDLLGPTPIGPLADRIRAGASIDELDELVGKLGATAWPDAFCFGWTRPKPPPPKGERPEREPPLPPHPDHGQDPRADDPAGSRPPGWGDDGVGHDDGTERAGDDRDDGPTQRSDR